MLLVSMSGVGGVVPGLGLWLPLDPVGVVVVTRIVCCCCCCRTAIDKEPTRWLAVSLAGSTGCIDCTGVPAGAGTVLLSDRLERWSSSETGGGAAQHSHSSLPRL